MGSDDEREGGGRHYRPLGPAAKYRERERRAQGDEFLRNGVVVLLVTIAAVVAGGFFAWRILD